ncbi:uncharacterized protein DNG_08239 [Cephalotrichum gorgonifer]|uniref:Uncharacterized protein n=1 Tax=Cephalotrichum gorgonifer TaxID=2041049 RepID=A0AAE8SYY6_9PEZI|nr:uncharacterized protein DNG_08239 [Cephalotrichum gorgonifer]
MSIVTHDPTERDTRPNTNLLSLLTNHLVLQHTAPHLTARDRLALGATSNDFRHLVHHSPGVFRHLDLSVVKAAKLDLSHSGEAWRNDQDDENVTEDDFYSRPLRGVFATLQRRDLLSDVQTLVLDGLSVTAELCNEIITNPAYNVRILSVRGVKNLNERGLRGVLKYACRPSRPAGTPKLKGLYIFTEPSRDSLSKKPATPAHGEEASSGAASGDLWYDVKGRVVQRDISAEWANTLIDCQGIIAFDAVLCTGPCHLNSTATGTVPAGNPWAAATVALPGCRGCGSAPEGLTSFHSAADKSQLPLLPDVPLLSSSLRAATFPTSTGMSFVARCSACVQDRHCATCNVWWCEACYTPPQSGLSAVADFEYGARKVHRSCLECGYGCNDCISRTQKCCTGCGGGYCITHNEGSTSTLCDWCSTRKRRAAASRRQHSPPTTKSQLAWATWMRTQNSIGEQRARERSFPREALRCLAARS